MSASVRFTPEPVPGPPTELFRLRMNADSERAFDVSADGQRLLVIRDLDTTPAQAVEV